MPQKLKNEVAGKAMTQHCPMSCKSMKSMDQKKRWSDNEGVTRKGIQFGKKSHAGLRDKEPMYSSFQPDGLFVEAPVGKGLNHWERKAKSILHQRTPQMMTSKSSVKSITASLN